MTAFCGAWWFVAQHTPLRICTSFRGWLFWPFHARIYRSETWSVRILGIEFTVGREVREFLA